MKKYIYSTIYWFLVTTIAVAPGMASLFDMTYLIILALGAFVYFIFVKKYYPKYAFKLVMTSIVVIIISSIISPLTVFRYISFKHPPNPFAYLDGESGSTFARAGILDWRYWAPWIYKKEFLDNIPKARLIKFSQHGQAIRLRGIDQNKIIEAFGQPANITEKAEFEIWEYHPWDEHPSWIMPVYLKDGVLWNIGD
ncbi:MAG TPA: hypothetical protein VJB41_00870 [Patescibacteria group bacterium]|nr:hypothetical protein [Patescibacteria group bacterium]